MKIVDNKGSEDEVRVDVVVKTVSSLFSGHRHVNAKLDVSWADTILSKVYHLFILGYPWWELLNQDLVVLIRHQLNELRISISNE
jgi:hypothetical protein